MGFQVSECDEHTSANALVRQPQTRMCATHICGTPADARGVDRRESSPMLPALIREMYAPSTTSHLMRGCELYTPAKCPRSGEMSTDLVDCEPPRFKGGKNPSNKRLGGEGKRDTFWVPFQSAVHIVLKARVWWLTRTLQPLANILHDLDSSPSIRGQCVLILQSVGADPHFGCLPFPEDVFESFVQRVEPDPIPPGEVAATGERTFGCDERLFEGLPALTDDARCELGTKSVAWNVGKVDMTYTHVMIMARGHRREFEVGAVAIMSRHARQGEEIQACEATM